MGQAWQGDLPNTFIFYLKTPAHGSKASEHPETVLCCEIYLGWFSIALKRFIKMRLLFLKKKIYLFIYLAVPGLSCGMQRPEVLDELYLTKEEHRPET